MTEVQDLARPTTRPVTVTAAAGLVCLAAAGTTAQTIMFVISYRMVGNLEILALVLQTLVPAAAYVATLPGLLRGRSWAQVALSAVAGVAVLSQLPQLLVVLVRGPDWVVLAYSAATLVLALVVALLWTRSARAWFGPVR